MNTLESLLQKIDESVARTTELDRYYSGTQPLAFLSPEAKIALGTRFGRLASNLCRLQVTALAERLRVVGFTGADIWADWLTNDLDQLSGVAHREALLLGDAFVLVWADGRGRPRVTIESAKQIAVRRDPASRQIVAAVKRWEDPQANATYAVLYEPDKITRYRADTAGATIAGFQVLNTITNPLGVPPIVALHNSDRLLDDYGTSEIEDLKPLVDALNKALVDLMTTSEYVGRPRRWATGVELVEEPVLAADPETGVVAPVVDEDGEPVMRTENPYPEGNRMMISEAENAHFGQLAAADLGGYEAAVRVILGQIQAVSTLPSAYLGVMSDQPPSADALRASESSLVARAEARQATFGRSWEQVARLIVAVRDGVNPASVDVRVQWADAATRSVAQESDAITKLYAAGLLPASFALKRLGYTDDEIAEIRTARRAEVLDGAGVDLLRRPPNAVTA